MERYPRESFTLADKLPAWKMKSQDDVRRMFEESLELCGVEYFDFYLLHSVEESHLPTYEKYGCFEFLQEMKRQGKIRHIGFSYHDNAKLLDRILSDHPEIEKIYKDYAPEKSVASWALRYIASLDGVMTVLSGMSDEEQMRDNLDTFVNFEPMKEEEYELVNQVTSRVLSFPTISCTGCRYCVPGCPMQIQISDLIKIIRRTGTERLLHAWPADNARMYVRSIWKSSLF